MLDLDEEDQRRAIAVVSAPVSSQSCAKQTADECQLESIFGGDFGSGK
jgi:hypothetical protein